MKTITLAPSDISRFWTKVVKGDGCWDWTGSTYGSSSGNKYGCFWLGGQNHLAHRVSYTLAAGAIPEDLVIDHKCHNRLCVNPRHLQAVTGKQNLENFSGPMRNSKSGIRGVYWQKRARRWYGATNHNGKAYWTPHFLTVEEAEKAVIELRKELHSNNLMDRVA